MQNWLSMRAGEEGEETWLPSYLQIGFKFTSKSLRDQFKELLTCNLEGVQNLGTQWNLVEYVGSRYGHVLTFKLPKLGTSRPPVKTPGPKITTTNNSPPLFKK